MTHTYAALQHSATHSNALQNTATHRRYIALPCDITRTYVHVSGPQHSQNNPHQMWRDPSILDMTHTYTHVSGPHRAIIHYFESYVTWLIFMRHDFFIYDMTQSCMTWHISYVTGRIYLHVSQGHIERSHATSHYVWHASCTYDIAHSFVTWLIQAWHDSYIYTRVPWPHGGYWQTPHLWMTCVTNKRVMSRMFESCHIWRTPSTYMYIYICIYIYIYHEQMSHVTNVWVMSHMTDTLYIYVCIHDAK